jgi:putative membrane protein
VDEFYGISRKVNPHLPKTRAGWLIGAISLLIVLAVAVLLLAPREGSVSHLDVSALPLLNASLNAASGILLAAGYIFIRRQQVERHRFCMLSAFGLSILFLVSYVIYHAITGSVSFAGQGWIRPIYFTILTSHIILAALVAPLALTTLYRAWQGTFVQHRQIARWTLPIWLYVSVSGVMVYVMLYHWNRVP